jgi:RecA-family ATPase
VDGDSGTGKSAMTTDLAARVSVGRDFPDGTSCEPSGVVILNVEDGLADTICPRLEAAGAGLGQVLALAAVAGADGSERLLSIPEDLDTIRCGIARVDAGLVIVDPMMAFVSGRINTHKDHDVRRALAPLATLAVADADARLLLYGVEVFCRYQGDLAHPAYAGPVSGASQ